VISNHYKNHWPIFSAAVGLFLLTGLFNAVFASRYQASLSISEDGVFLIRGAVVTRVIGNSFLSQVRWGDSFIRLIVRTGDKTTFSRRFGGVSGASEITEGNILNIDGDLQPGADDLSVNAKSVVNLSLEDEPGAFSGSVKSIDPDNNLFVITLKGGANLTVKIGTSTSMIKGVLGLPIGGLKVGDEIEKVDGVYNYPTRTIDASSIRVYQDKIIFKPRNFQGTLRAAGGASLPTQLIVTVDDKDFTVYLDAKAAVLNNKRRNANLARFLTGDTVRFYGAIRQTNLSAIDADTVRNLDL
jgi:hypothetical protein